MYLTRSITLNSKLREMEYYATNYMKKWMNEWQLYA